MRRKFRCRARTQGITDYCDGCKKYFHGSGKCPQRNKYRDLRNTKKGRCLYVTCFEM